MNLLLTYIKATKRVLKYLARTIYYYIVLGKSVNINRIDLYTYSDFS